MRRAVALCTGALLTCTTLVATVAPAHASKYCGQTVRPKNPSVQAEVHIACVDGRNMKASGWVKDLRADASAGQFGFTEYYPATEQRYYTKVAEDTDSKDGRAVSFRDRKLDNDLPPETFCVWIFNHRDRRQHVTCV